MRGHLLRIFGLGFGVAVVIGGVIGSGIMRNPGVVATGLLQPWLILLAWLAGGLFVAIDAMPVVELGTAVPLAGGPYPLARRALGPWLGFVVGWADWMQLAISTGFIAVAFGEYVHRFGLLTNLTAGQIAIMLAVFCGGLNWIGAKVGGLSQSIGSAVKALGLAILVAALFIAGGRVDAANAPPPPAFSWAAAMIALRAIYGAYGGWQAAVYFSEEVHDPQRNVARATFMGIALVTAMYFLVNAVVLYVLPIGILAQSKLAVADAVQAVFGGGGAIVTALAIWSVATLVNLQIMEHARNTFSMARAGALPGILTRVSRSGTPRPALLVVLASTILIVLAVESLHGPLYEILLELYAPFIMLSFLLLGVGSIRLRRTEPDLLRPWKMPFFPVPAILSIVLNTVLLGLFLQSDWKTGLGSALLLLLGLVLFALTGRRIPD